MSHPPYYADLSEKTALVTGSTSGIGKATALALAAAGTFVAVSGRDKEKGQAVVDQILASGGTAVFVQADLVDANAATDLAARATDALGGRVDVLVNSAGVFPFGPTESHDEATFDAVYALNVKAPLFLVRPLPRRWRSVGAAPSSTSRPWSLSSALTAWRFTVQPRRPSSSSPRRGPLSSGRGASASTQSALDRPALKGQRGWARRWTSWRRWRRQDDRPGQRRSPRPSCFLRATRRASFTAPCSLSMVAAQRREQTGSRSANRRTGHPGYS